MENSYGITIKNKYELFLENDDPLEILREQERKAAARKAEKGKKSDKDSKSSAKNKQNKTTIPANVASTTAQEVKIEKGDTPLTPGKSEEKQKRQKSNEDESRLLKDRGNRQKPLKEEGGNQDEGEKLEIGTFEARGTGSGMRERRGGRGRGGFRSNPERSPKENVEGGTMPDRYPRRGPPRGFRSNNYGDRNVENQENGNLEISQFDSKPNFSSNGFGQPSEERRERQFNNEDRRVFSGRRRDDGENRGFGGYRRSYENRGPRRNFSNRQPQDSGMDAAGNTEDTKASGFEEPQQEVESFGHWGAENSGGDEALGGGMVRGRGRGIGRRSRGRGRPGFGGRKEFNRRGGSNEGGFGFKPIEKRDGTGSHNWGTVMDDLEAQNEAATGAGASWAEQAEAAEHLENSGNAGAPYEDESGAASAQVGPEMETMTLDEYKAVMETKRLKMEFNVRKPGEGCSDDKWNKTYVLKKKEQPKEDESEDEVAEDERHNKARNVFPIEITFSDSRRSRGRAFGGRRGSRGGFERGGFAGRRGQNPGPRGVEKKPPRERAPNVADEHDFPSLVPSGAAQ